MRFAWVMLLCLLAALPPQVCACDHADHDPVPTEQHDDGLPADEHEHEHDDPGAPGCPCECHVAPREIATAPRSVDGTTDEQSVPVADALIDQFDHFRSPPAALPCGEPPTRRPHSALPLYLSTARLRN